jgi:hypothetical protein
VFVKHPSSELNALFSHKPYQGVAPEQSNFMFVGLDANYDQQIEDKPIFAKVREYHSDGVAFWQKHGVHHPFLLPQYMGSGQLYHRSFANIGFKPSHANQVSFVELLNVPTVGRNVLTATDLSSEHLLKLNSAILTGNASHIFISAGVARLMQATKLFPWLANSPQKHVSGLDTYFNNNTKTVYSHLHFSVYGKFQARKLNQASIIHSFLQQTA